MLMDTDQYKVLKLKGLFYLKKKLPHDRGVAYHGSSLVCYIYSVTYLEYKSACQVIYAVAY